MNVRIQIIHVLQLGTTLCYLYTCICVVSGYGLGDLVIEVRSLAEAKGFFL
jgi:hypothetical protein